MHVTFVVSQEIIHTFSAPTLGDAMSPMRWIVNLVVSETP